MSSGIGKSTTPVATADEASALGLIPLSQDEFVKFRDLIFEVAGISLNDTKHQLVASRLSKRLRSLGLKSFAEYHAHLTRSGRSGDEMTAFINCITTNKTFFFRENHHFDFLRSVVLPEAERGGRRLRIWSAACSTGEEPYSIAMTIAEAVHDLSAWDVKILATDIDTEVLAHAGRGEYREEKLEGLSRERLDRWFRAARDQKGETFTAKESLKALLTFRRLNFNDADWGIKGAFDLIFCRNAMIYFNRDTQTRVVKRFHDYLEQSGHLIIGHSENLHWMSELFEPIQGTIYRRREAGAPSARSASASIATNAPAEPFGKSMQPPPLRFVKPAGLSRAPMGAEPVRNRTDLVQAAKKAQDATTSRIDGLGKRAVAITIGGLWVGKDETTVRTVLGSCIAACIFDPVAKVGGMNHFLLPDGTPDDSMPTRYGVHAMEVLINEVMKAGGDRARLKAKIFGASHVLKMAQGPISVPERNAAFIRSFLATEGIAILAEKLGGTRPLEVHFEVATGKAFVRALGETAATPLVAAESRFQASVTKDFSSPSAPQSVTLF